MKYRYNTVTGKHEIEVDEQLYSILLAMDKENDNSDRKYYRHNPISFSSADYDGNWMEDETDVLGYLILSEDRERLQAALAQLTLDQQILIECVFFNREKIVDIAKKAGVSEAAIRNRLNRICKRVKKTLE